MVIDGGDHNGENDTDNNDRQKTGVHDYHFYQKRKGGTRCVIIIRMILGKNRQPGAVDYISKYNGLGYYRWLRWSRLTRQR